VLGDHLSSSVSNSFDGDFCCFDRQVAADDRRPLASERQGGGAAHAAACARDDAYLAFEAARHLPSMTAIPGDRILEPLVVTHASS
jgi:hypothetical protein